MSQYSTLMPVLFVGHGNPMNAIEDNEFSREWKRIGKTLPKPRAILCISAHWESWGTLVTAMDKPRTIHDFGGFPRELYQMQYPAPGSAELAKKIQKILGKTVIGLDKEWGLDHGCWSVMSRLFPDADIPVVQLSLDSAKSCQAQYDLARELAPLRNEGVLIIGSGNIIHNLYLVELKTGVDDFNQPFAFDWAVEASKLIKKLIRSRDHQSLIHYESLGKPVKLAVPTPEHYLPLLYVLALMRKEEEPVLFNDKHIAGSLTMTSLISAVKK